MAENPARIARLGGQRLCLTSSPRSAQEIYSEIRKLTGVTVHIDPRVKNSIISMEIDAGSAAEAFDAVAEAAGYFWVPVDS